LNVQVTGEVLKVMPTGSKSMPRVPYYSTILPGPVALPACKEIALYACQK
jgi:hypothetical protein